MNDNDTEARFNLKFNLHKMAMLPADEREAEYFGAIYRCGAEKARAWIEEFDRSVEEGAQALRAEYPGLCQGRGELSGTLCFAGDSITSDRESYGKIIGRFFDGIDGFSVVDCAISGSNSQSFTGWIYMVLEHGPRYVSIMHATNDLRSNKDGSHLSVTSVEEYARNLRYFIESLKKTGAVACLTTPPPAYNPWIDEAYGERNWLFEDEIRLRFIEAIRSVAKEYGLALNDMEPVYARHETVDLLMDDGLHLNIAGQRLLAKHLLPVLCGMMQGA